MVLDKREASRALARYVINPVVSLVAGYVPWWALLETKGRRTGRPRRNPVGNGLKGDTFWIVAEHGEQAAYIKNIRVDPSVRLRVGGRWRRGVAHLLPHDDPRERQRRLRPVNAAFVRLMGTDLLTVRIDLDSASDEGKQDYGAVTVAALVAAGVSGLPSTLHALSTRRSPLEAIEAAGSIVLPQETRRGHLIAAAAGLHLALSLFWANIIARSLRPHQSELGGAAAGVAIATIDSIVIGRRWPRIRALPLAPQIADHVAFGVVVAAMLRRSRVAHTSRSQRGRERSRSPSKPWRACGRLR